MKINEQDFLRDVEARVGFNLTPKQRLDALQVLSDAKTNALCDKADKYLDEAEAEAKRFAARRNAGFSNSGIREDESDEFGSVRERIMKWAKRTSRNKLYGSVKE